jgi:hypothetical protein
MAGESAAGEDGPPIFHGISLGRFAAVKAALAEGFSLRAVLAVEELDRKAYGEADLAWMARLARDKALFERYVGELADAEDWLARRVVPLDVDLAAWITFQTALSSSGAAANLLRNAGIGLNDVSRLSRSWTKRMDEDDSLKEKAAELGQEGPGELPRITAEPARLRRSRAAGPPAPKKAPSAPAAATAPALSRDEAAALEVDRYASLQAELQIWKGDEERLLRKYGIASEEARAALEQRWRARLEKDPALARDYRALHAYFLTQAETARRAGHHEPAGDALPAVVSYAPEAYAAPIAVAPPPRPDAGGTLDIAAILARPALPFAADTTPPSEALRNAEAHAAEVQGPALPRRPMDAGGTVDVKAILRRPAIPFAGAAQAPSPPVEAPRAPQASRPDAGGTVDIKAILRGGPALPFAAAKPASPPAEPPRAPQPSRPDAGGTVDVKAILKGPALPFAAAPPAPPAPAAPAPAASPLTLEQYASLCVELQRRPDRIAETLGRYRVTAEQRAQLDAYWRSRLAADPALYVSFASACAAYRAWLAQSGR